ncbi:murein transglycosylase A [Marinivivus vitaminiproducens]|uniref:murein transglycosylase A n=1 Tax=Marinivivus vitaminiproducens TaxID=3035935 RepID=UPI0027990D85|nr:murein transglycosylase A [Geminicoccaceae bacterium SCSIO 64248]
MQAQPRALLVAAALLVLASIVVLNRPVPGPDDRSGADEAVLTELGFDDIEGWTDDRHSAALAAFRRSCGPILRRDPARDVGTGRAARPAAVWQEACRDASELGPEPDDAAARAFFERRFTPYRVESARNGSGGVFTGYYEPQLRGSRTAHGAYATPLYRLPQDLITADLGAFHDDLAGRKLTGRIEDGALVPYYDRAAIDRGALGGRGLEIVYVDDPVAAFFLHVQGSGQVVLDTGQTVRVGYAGQNGRAYRAIGRDLIAMGEVPAEAMSMQAIRDWLITHPERAAGLMARNPSYIFFTERSELAAAEGPLGAQGVSLTPERSMAVDPRFLPLGAPVWLEAASPGPEHPAPLRRLMVAQDTGGAIRGVVRGDVFWGAGSHAETIAGHMKADGSYVVLLPGVGETGSAAVTMPPGAGGRS